MPGQPRRILAAAESVERNAADMTRGTGNDVGDHWILETATGCIWNLIRQGSGAENTAQWCRWFRGRGTDRFTSCEPFAKLI